MEMTAAIVYGGVLFLELDAIGVGRTRKRQRMKPRYVVIADEVLDYKHFIP